MFIHISISSDRVRLEATMRTWFRLVSLVRLLQSQCLPLSSLAALSHHSHPHRLMENSAPSLIDLLSLSWRMVNLLRFFYFHLWVGLNSSFPFVCLFFLSPWRYKKEIQKCHFWERMTQIITTMSGPFMKCTWVWILLLLFFDHKYHFHLKQLKIHLLPLLQSLLRLSVLLVPVLHPPSLRMNLLKSTEFCNAWKQQRKALKVCYFSLWLLFFFPLN